MVFALHWFNPLMWVAYFLMSRDMEMSCDEAVLRKTDEDIRRDYSTSLLSLSTNRVGLLNPIAFSYGEGSVKERIFNVLKFKKTANWVAVVSVVIVGAFLVGFTSDRALAIDEPPNIGNSSFMDEIVFDIDKTNWYTDEHGTRIASSEDAREIGMYILNKYFTAFRQEWESWGASLFYLTGYEDVIDLDGNVIPSWLFGRVSEAVEGERSFTHPFVFFIDAETGALDSINYFPSTTEHIGTSTGPFEIPISEAYEIYGDWWFWGQDMPLDLNGAYLDTLVGFSLELFSQSGFLSDAIIAVDSSLGGNFANGFVNINVYVTYANGKHATLSFWAHDTHFTISGLTIVF